jgi:chromate transporter
MKPTTAQLTGVIFRIGNTTFGGGFVTMLVIGRDFIERRGWLKQNEFDIAFALARITPGTNIVAFCAAVGSILRGWPGAILAVLAVTAPPAAIAVLLMQGFETWRNHPWVGAALATTVAAVTGMMWATVWMLTRPHIGSWRQTLRTVVILAGSFGAAWMGVTPVPIILAATAIGFLWLDGDAA